MRSIESNFHAHRKNRGPSITGNNYPFLHQLLLLKIFAGRTWRIYLSLPYELGPNWPVNIEVNVDVPEHVNLNFLKMTGAPNNEEMLIPEVATSNTTAAHPGKTDRNGQQQQAMELMDMSFSLNGCTRALFAVGGCNVEAATNLISEHNMDPYFKEPLPDEGGRQNAVSYSFPSSGIDEMVDSLGCFTFD